VLSYWTALEPPPAKTDRFQGSARDPKRGVQVAISAPHHNVATDRIAATAHDDDDPYIEQEDRYDGDDLATHGVRVRQQTSLRHEG
jgi:hypothetical protein